MPAFRLPVRQLVEFLLRTGSIDSRFAGFDRANEGARIHRKLQKAAGEGYQAEVFLSAEREACGIAFTLEGRADGIFTDENGTVTIDEIKTTAAPTDAITEDMNPCHWAQGMVYGAICAEQQELETLDVRLTYYQVDTDEIIRYTRHFSAAELDAFLNDLLRQYLPWARRQLSGTIMSDHNKNIRNATGISPFTNHICRHTFATRALEKGMNPKALSKILGHSSVAFTMSRYTTISKDFIFEQMKMIDF